MEQVEKTGLIQEVKDLVSAAQGDPTAAVQCETRLRDLKLEIDKVTDALEWPTLVNQARGWLREAENVANRHGTPPQRAKATRLGDEMQDIIDDGKMDRLRKKMEQIEVLYWEIVFAQPGFWVNQLDRLEKKCGQASDPARAARLIEQGRDCMAKNNINGLQNVVRQFWDLLPREAMAEAQRGYQSGLVK